MEIGTGLLKNIMPLSAMESRPMTSSSIERGVVRDSVAPNSGNQASFVRDCDQAGLLLHNQSNFKKSGRPGRVMYYENGSWIDFSNDVLDSLRSCFAEGKPMAEVEVGGSVCAFDLCRMLQIDVGAGTQRSIAWIDVDGKCFFPRRFVGDELNAREIDLFNPTVISSSEIPTVKLEIRVGCDLNFKKRKSTESDNEGSSSNSELGKPNKWPVLDFVSEPPKRPRLVLFREGERVYENVKRLFLAGFGNSRGTIVTRIAKCSLEKAQVEIFLKQMEIVKAARGIVRMTLGWLGTSAQGVASIFTHGFGMPLNVPSSQLHGIGVYLSPLHSAHVSSILSKADDKGEKHAILCRVILGSSEKVEAGSRRSFPSSVNYDTGLDDLDNPKWFVIWGSKMNTHILPECVVSYWVPHQAQGLSERLSVSRRISGSPKELTEKLYSLLESSLPKPKLQEFLALRQSFKKKNIAKDAFMKRLRCLAGDKLLCSVAREFRR